MWKNASIANPAHGGRRVGANLTAQKDALSFHDVVNLRRPLEDGRKGGGTLDMGKEKDSKVRV